MAGLNVMRRDAYFMSLALTLMVQVGIALCLFRLHSILSIIDLDHFPKAFAMLTMNEAIVTPFAFFGRDVVSRVHGALSYLLFFATMTLALAPTFLFRRPSHRSGLAEVAFMPLAGLVVVTMTWRTLTLTIERIGVTDPVTAQALSATFLEKNFCLLALPWGAMAWNKAIRRATEGPAPKGGP